MVHAGRTCSPNVLHVLKRWAAWPRGNRWLAGIAAVVLGLAIAWVLFVPVADWLAHHDVGSAKGPLLQTARDAARGRLLTLGAGLLAAGALLFTARNFTLSREGQVLPPSLFEHPAAELSVDDSAQLCEDRRQPGHIA